MDPEIFRSSATFEKMNVGELQELLRELLEKREVVLNSGFISLDPSTFDEPSVEMLLDPSFDYFSNKELLQDFLDLTPSVIAEYYFPQKKNRLKVDKNNFWYMGAVQ